MQQVKVVALPRDPNPYQELLYSSLRRQGIAVTYGARLTRSRTLNLLLCPAELCLRRLRGYRILHLHWVFGFTFPGAARFNVVRRLSRAWFILLLTWARLLGFRIVWTAHNVLPHDRVFDDDTSARRALVRRCALVIGHTSQAIDGLIAIGAPPARSCVMPLGPMTRSDAFLGLPEPGSHPIRTVLFFGRVAPYKGVEDLLIAVRDLPEPLNVVVAGACPDETYRSLLERHAASAAPRIRLSLEHVSDAAMPELFGLADALVYPFRNVTTSSSVMLGMAAARPIVIPDLPSFRDLPAESVIRYPPGVEGLREALRQVSSLPARTLKDKGLAARASTLSPSWEDVAARTAVCFDEVLCSRG